MYSVLVKDAIVAGVYTPHFERFERPPRGTLEHTHGVWSIFTEKEVSLCLREQAGVKTPKDKTKKADISLETTNMVLEKSSKEVRSSTLTCWYKSRTMITQAVI